MEREWSPSYPQAGRKCPSPSLRGPGGPRHFCLSETKICRDELQKIEDFLPQYEHQYWSCAVKKGYASTAIFSKTKPLSVKDEIIVGDHDSKGVSKSANSGKDQEGRFLALEYPKFWLVHTYVPNAGASWSAWTSAPTSGTKPCCAR